MKAKGIIPPTQPPAIEPLSGYERMRWRQRTNDLFLFYIRL